MMNLRPLQHFVLVAEEGSFQKAAARAHVTQPALSISIKTLESSVDMVLFERDQRPIRLTESGQQLLRIAKKLLFEARNCDQEIANYKLGMAGTLNVGFVPNFAASFGGSVLAAWKEKCPGVGVFVDTEVNQSLLDRLRAETLDIIVCDPGEVADPTGLEFETIPTADAGFFCRPGHPVLSGPLSSFADLKGFDLATVNLSPKLRHRVNTALGKAFDFENALSVQTNNIAVLRDVVMESDCLLLSLRRSLRHEVRAGFLVEIPIAVPIAAAWATATTEGRVLHPSATVLADIVSRLDLES